MKKISIIIPAYNEELGITHLVGLLDKATGQLKDYSFIYLFINDGSTDKTGDILSDLSNKRKDMKYINLSRNFGKEIALTAGIEASGEADAVIMLDADGQHPPNKIGEFIQKWEGGALIVVGLRKLTKEKDLFRRIGSTTFNIILRLLTSSHDGVDGRTDFRLLDKKVALEFTRFSERSRITRGLIDWMGFERAYVEFNASARAHGKASYSTRMLFRLALHAFTSHSTRPLKLVGFLGVLISFLSFVVEVTLLVYTFVLKDPSSLHISGTFHVGVFISFMMGLVLVCQGLVALYIENIYVESQARPLYLIADKNF